MKDIALIILGTMAVVSLLSEVAGSEAQASQPEASQVTIVYVALEECLPKNKPTEPDMLTAQR